MSRAAGAAALALLLAACSGDAGASSGPRPQIHTISVSGDQDPPSYIWHGTIDGRECIVIDDHAKANFTCDWSAR